MRRDAEIGARRQHDRRHQHDERGRWNDHRAERGHEVQPADDPPRPVRPEQLHRLLGEQARGAGVLHRDAERQHARDQKDRAPFDGAIGVLHAQAPREDHRRHADDRRDVDRQPARQYRRDDGDQDHRGDRRLRRVDRAPRQRRQHEEVRIAAQQPQAVPRTEQQQRVAELEHELVEVGADRLALAPDGDELEAVLLAKVDLDDRLAHELGAGLERRLDHAQAVRFEHVHVLLLVALDDELLQTAKHVEILLAALNQQQVAPLQRLVGFRHDPELALPEQREQPEVERVAEAAARQRLPGEHGLARHADDEDALLQAVHLADVGLGHGPAAGELRRALELLDRLGASLHQQHVARPQRHVGEVHAPHQLVAPDGEHVHVEPLAKLGVVQKLRHERRILGDRGLDEPHLPGHETLKDRRLALDDELAPTLELAEAVERSLQQQLVSAFEHGLARRHGLGPAATLEREHDQACGGAQPALRERLADQDRVLGNAHVEASRLQAVQRAQVALTAPLRLRGRHLLRQPMPGEQRDERRADEHQRGAERREIEDAEAVVAARRQRPADQQIRRRSDERRQAAEQRAVGHGHEQPRRRDTRAPRDLDDDGQHQRGDADVVHEEGHRARGQHDDDDDPGFPPAGEPQHGAADDVGDARAREPFAENEHGPDGDDGAVREAGDRLLGRHKPGQHEAAEHHERRDVHTDFLADEQDQGEQENAEDEADFERQVRAPSTSRR